MVLLDAVAGRQAVIVPTLHRTRRTAAFRRADHVPRFNILEPLRRRQNGADRRLRGFVETEFADEALRLTVRLGRHGHAGGGASGAALRPQGVGDVAALGADRFAPRLVEIADLQRVVTVALLIADLQDRT